VAGILPFEFCFSALRPVFAQPFVSWNELVSAMSRSTTDFTSENYSGHDLGELLRPLDPTAGNRLQ
jgi:hypothetical protein